MKGKWKGFNILEGAQRMLKSQQAQKEAYRKIQLVLDKLTTEEVDNLVPDEGEFKLIADAVMSWYVLLFASKIIRDRKEPNVMETLAASLLILGTIIKYTYALGIRRGEKKQTNARKQRSKP